MQKKGILIPRMLTIERTSISTPANGLLVFDTNTKIFWYYNVDTWKELAGGVADKIINAEGDTRVEVEDTPDKKISSILICRLWRNSSDSQDTYSDDAGLLSLDFHYQIDTVGSRSQYTK